MNANIQTMTERERPFRICEYCGAHLDPGEKCDCGNEKKAPKVVDEWAEAIKKTREPVRALRMLSGRKQEEFADFVRKRYPLFDTPLLCKCENSRNYGVTLLPEIYDSLIAEFVPELIPVIQYERGGRHSRRCRVSGRLPDNVYEKFVEKIRLDGFETVQAWIEYSVITYLKEVKEND